MEPKDIQILRETVGYLKSKAKELRHINTNQNGMFEERADALERLINSQSQAIALTAPTNKNYSMGCKLSGPGRGDCEHFIGIPKELNEKTTDEYGIPHRWCDYCWMAYRFSQAQVSMEEIAQLIRDNGEYKEKFAVGLMDMVEVHVKPLAQAIYALIVERNK